MSQHSQGRVLPSSANASPGRWLTAPPVSMPDACLKATPTWAFALGVPPSSPALDTLCDTVGHRTPILATNLRLCAGRAALLACTRCSRASNACPGNHQRASMSGMLPSSPAHDTAGRRTPILTTILRLCAGRAALLACATQQGVKRLFWIPSYVFALSMPPSSPARHSRASSACVGKRPGLHAARAALLACAVEQRGPSSATPACCGKR